MDVGGLLLIALVIVLVVIALVTATRTLNNSVPTSTGSGELGGPVPHPLPNGYCLVNCSNRKQQCEQRGGTNCENVYGQCMDQCTRHHTGEVQGSVPHPVPSPGIGGCRANCENMRQLCEQAGASNCTGIYNNCMRHCV